MCNHLEKRNRGERAEREEQNKIDFRYNVLKSSLDLQYQA